MDQIEKIGNSVIQHGKGSDRVYIMHLEKEDLPELLDEVLKLTVEYAYTKIFAKVPASCSMAFRAQGFQTEAFIPAMINGREDVMFMSLFTSQERAQIDAEPWHIFEDVLINKEITPFVETVQHPIQCLTSADTTKLAALYKDTFDSYPFPIFDPAYLEQTMQENISYYGIYQGDQLIAAASSEKDEVWKSVEMTDFAVSKTHRGQKLANYLLSYMENEMQKEGFHCLFTIARLHEPAMNVTFMKSGYQYSGTLINNTNIAGKIESMNILYKNLA